MNVRADVSHVSQLESKVCKTHQRVFAEAAIFESIADDEDRVRTADKTERFSDHIKLILGVTSNNTNTFLQKTCTT